MILEGELLMSLLPVDKAQEIAINKATDMITGELEKSGRETEKLLAVYNDTIKNQLKSIVTQHKIVGGVAGALPTLGIATTLNLIVLYVRLSKAVNMEVLVEFDELFSKAIRASGGAFIALGVVLVGIKFIVTALEVSGIGLPPGLLAGAISGAFLTHKAGLNFANNVSKMVDEALLSEETKQLPPKKGFLRRMIPFM